MAEIGLDLEIATEKNVRDVQISAEKRVKRVAIEIEKSTTPHEEYAGPYEVTPQFFYEKTLPTARKLMTRDVAFLPIQVASVSNPAGGRTITIG